MRRDVMDRLCLKLVQRTFLACDVALAGAGMGPRDVHAVLLAGGTTNLPMVQKNVEAYFGREGLREFEPTAVVAQGASRVPK